MFGEASERYADGCGHGCGCGLSQNHIYERRDNEVTNLVYWNLCKDPQSQWRIGM